MSPKARKETKRAVSALKSAKLDEAEKRLGAAYKLSPTSADLNFLLGYLYFQKRDYTRAGTYLNTAVNLNPRDAQALTLLGRTGLEKQDYPGARSALEQAIAADAENWFPHNLLAAAYLHERNYDKARDEAQLAITKGKTNAGSAHLVLGQALVGLGHDQEGVQALNIFLQEMPQDVMAKQVRDLIAEVKEHESSPAPAENAKKIEAQISGINNLASLPPPGFSVKPWQPPSVDEVRLALAPGVVCPSERVIEESGKRVRELVDDATRFAAVEDLFHQALDRMEIQFVPKSASITTSLRSLSLNPDSSRSTNTAQRNFPSKTIPTTSPAMALPHWRSSSTRHARQFCTLVRRSGRLARASNMACTLPPA